jgi:methyltransferase (TIGR00027 family)
VTGPLRDVGDTAFWVAQHRADETARPDALLDDPFAARLAGERGRRIAAAMPTSSIVGWSVVLRTRIIDAFIERALAAGIDTVLCLGAGLDARPWRLTLPPQLRWVEADQPQMLQYKQSILQGVVPRCRLEQVAIDLSQPAARRELLARTDAESQGFLVITEGVIPYLSNSDVAALADELRGLARARYWIVDYFSAEGMRWRRRKQVSRSMQNAPFLFDPGDWLAFFRAHGWGPGELRYFADEAQRVRRPMPLPLPLRAVLALTWRFAPPARREAFRTSTGYAMLEPQPLH